MPPAPATSFIIPTPLQMLIAVATMPLLLAGGESIPTTLDGPFKPSTRRFDPSLRRGSDDLPIDHPRLRKSNVSSDLPEQIALALSTPSSMWVSWVTGDAVVGKDVKPIDATLLSSEVWYGKEKGNYTLKKKGNATVYSQLYPFDGLLNYTSGIIHHVLIDGLEPDTKYYYRCGDSSVPAMSEEISFDTLPLPSKDSYPHRIAFVGDLGLTSNTTTTIDHLMDNDPSLVVIVGDLTYANQYRTTGGKGASCFSCSFPDAPIRETYQPRWDAWGRFMEPLTSKVPMMVIEGNHEIEPQASGVTFKSYSERFAVPSTESGSNSNFYYSFDAGGVHFVMLGAYVDYNQTGAQYAWLKEDLSKVDRSVTPWLVATMHPPWYNSYSSHYQEFECMRQEMEELLYQHRVDIIFAGHVHAYERMNRIYNYTLVSSSSSSFPRISPTFIEMTPVSNAPSVDAQIVGNAFVQKYYTHLYEKPAEVYRFYLEESVLGRPGLDGEMVSVKSLKAINDQIMSVDYQNSKIQILTADSQASLKSAVVTLVAGLVIGKDGERKSFTQSFFLVPQNGSYFVLNDVFRYVSDVFVAPEATKEAEVEVEESPKEAVPEPAKEVVEPAARATNEEKVVNGNTNLPKAAEAKPQEDAGVKKSFAVIAAQNGAQTNAKASPAKPKPVEKPRVAPQAKAAPQPKAPSAKTSEQPPAQGGSIFVANLPMDASPEQLFETFKGFGAIRRGGIQVRSYTEQRNCFGFVAFENSESIKNVFKAHNESPIFIGNRRASIEEKRVNNNENGGRAYARNNGNNRNENGYRKDGYRPRGNGVNGGRGSGRNGPERQSGDAKASQNGHGNAQAKN